MISNLKVTPWKMADEGTEGKGGGEVKIWKERMKHEKRKEKKGEMKGKKKTEMKEEPENTTNLEKKKTKRKLKKIGRIQENWK